MNIRILLTIPLMLVGCAHGPGSHIQGRPAHAMVVQSAPHSVPEDRPVAGGEPFVGEPFEVVTSPIPIVWVDDIRFAGRNRILLCGSSGLLVSDSGGASWLSFQTSADGGAIDCDHAAIEANGSIMFNGFHRHWKCRPEGCPVIVMSQDGGQSWTGVHSPGGEVPTTVGGGLAIVDGFGGVYRPTRSGLPLRPSSITRELRPFLVENVMDGAVFTEAEGRAVAEGQIWGGSLGGWWKPGPNLGIELLAASEERFWAVTTSGNLWLNNSGSEEWRQVADLSAFLHMPKLICGKLLADSQSAYVLCSDTSPYHERLWRVMPSGAVQAVDVPKGITAAGISPSEEIWVATYRGDGSRSTVFKRTQNRWEMLMSL